MFSQPGEDRAEARLGQAINHILRTRESTLEVDGTLSVLVVCGSPSHETVRRVRVFRTDPPQATCECPDFEEHGEVCQHIWFVLLTSYKVNTLMAAVCVLPTALNESSRCS